MSDPRSHSLLPPALSPKIGPAQEFVHPWCEQDCGTGQVKINSRWGEIKFSLISPQNRLILKSIKGVQSAGNASYIHDQNRG